MNLDPYQLYTECKVRDIARKTPSMQTVQRRRWHTLTRMERPRPPRALAGWLGGRLVAAGERLRARAAPDPRSGTQPLDHGARLGREPR